MNIDDIRKDFPILENRKIAYLDNSATTQKPLPVLEKIDEFYKTYNANVHRGAYSLSIEASERYENARAKIAKFINSRFREEIIFSKNASWSMIFIPFVDNFKFKFAKMFFLISSK